MTPLTVVCWRWEPFKGYRSTFGPDTVRILRSMVARHYRHPHRFVCITDRPEDLPDVETIRLWDDYKDIPSPHGGKNPSCYRRLRAFSPEMVDVLGPRFVSMDLDCVVTGDLSMLWNRPEDLVCWGDTNPRNAFNGSMFLHTSGTRRQVWEKFDPRTSPDEAKRAGKFGSDQAWLSYVLSPTEAKWTKRDGVFSFRNDIRPRGCALPDGARLIFFHGEQDPWGAKASTIPWVREHYRLTFQEAVSA